MNCALNGVLVQNKHHKHSYSYAIDKKSASFVLEWMG